MHRTEPFNCLVDAILDLLEIGNITFNKDSFGSFLGSLGGGLFTLLFVDISDDTVTAFFREKIGA